MSSNIPAWRRNYDHSYETMHRIEVNDTELKILTLGDCNVIGGFVYNVVGDLFRLGTAIGKNTHLTSLVIISNGERHDRDHEIPLRTSHKFYEGLKRNSSICTLKLCSCNTDVIHEILNAYQQKSNQLTTLVFRDCNLPLQNAGNCVINTLTNCTNIEDICIVHCGLTDQQLIPMLEAIKGHCSLERINLRSNRIGNESCKSLSLFLENPNSKLKSLGLHNNNIGNEGVEVLASSLRNNHQLRRLYLGSNQIDPDILSDVFSRLLCDASSINNTYSSNHTLSKISNGVLSERLQSLLNMNEDKNKRLVAIEKIFQHHTNIDMRPLFGWDLNDEHTLKSLPCVVGWFERAFEAHSIEMEKHGGPGLLFISDWRMEGIVKQIKLSAIYQFALAMPLLFESAKTKGDWGYCYGCRKVLPKPRSSNADENDRLKVYKQSFRKCLGCSMEEELKAANDYALTYINRRDLKVPKGLRSRVPTVLEKTVWD